VPLLFRQVCTIFLTQPNIIPYFRISIRVYGGVELWLWRVSFFTSRTERLPLNNISTYKQGFALEEFVSLFQLRFNSNATPIVLRSPGRVNLIGEHTDYNKGFVLPAAIDKAIYFAVAPRRDLQFKLYSLDMNEWYEGNLRALKHADTRWPNYLIGIVDQLMKAGYEFEGFDCMFGGDVPIGAGLSSSAALEGGLIFALNEIFHLKIDKLSLVKFAQRAENEFVGVQCGIMDQFINLFGEDKKVLKIDCRSLEYEQIPLDTTTLSIVLCETQTRRALASSEYNIRFRQCEEGVKILSTVNPSISSLRDVTMTMLEANKTVLSPTVYRRCEFVVKENQRVLEGCEDLRRNDVVAFGRKMYLSHEGLSREYEVSSTELDFLVEFAAGQQGVLGARMMGAGFGGCTINLVKEQVTDSFVSAVKNHYLSKTRNELQIHIVKLKSGTKQIH
jgi:galactokinase